MKSKKLRTLIPLAIVVVAGIGYALHLGTGTISAAGWQDISILCPLGALTTMLASKTFVPRALISLILAVIAIILLGRAFCAWACPVPVVSKLRDLLKRQDKIEETAAEKEAVTAPLSKEEQALLKGSCKTCGASKPENSRHVVLGGALLSAAIFGFPVFCLICPIGLTFAFVFALMLLFGNGDVTWGVVIIPALLLIEVVFFRKWCSHICPLSAIMSLVGKANKTFKPTIDESKCIESAGGTCGRCGQACEVGIDPRHPELGASWSECTKCRACVEACPAQAITMPFLPKKSDSEKPVPEPETQPASE